METLTEEELATRLDFLRPLNPPPPDEPHDMWPIPFEYGNGGKGMRISIATAKTIAAELRAEVAEAEKRDVLRAFKQERTRCESFGAQLRDAQDATQRALDEIATLKRVLHTARRKKVARGRR